MHYATANSEGFVGSASVLYKRDEYNVLLEIYMEDYSVIANSSSIDRYGPLKRFYIVSEGIRFHLFQGLDDPGVDWFWQLPYLLDHFSVQNQLKGHLAHP